MANAINGMPKGSASHAWKGGRRKVKGYIGIYAPQHPRASVSNLVPEHILIVEKVLGYILPLTVRVHHVNKITDDNRNANLVVCQSEAYHALLHRRMRILEAGGNPDTDKICGGCHQPKKKEEFHKSRQTPDGYYGRCKDCRAQKRLDDLAIAA